MDSRTALFIIGIGSFILVAIYLILLYKFFRKIFTSPNIFGYSIQLRVLNLSLTSIIFRSFFYAVFQQPIKLMFDIISIIFSALINIVTKDLDEVPYSEISNIMNNIFFKISTYVETFILNTNFFLSLLFAMVVGIIFNTLFNQIGFKTKLESYFHKISSSYIARQNIALILLLLGSLYLVICSMIAIPYNSADLQTLNQVSRSTDSTITLPNASLEDRKISNDLIKDTSALYKIITSTDDSSLTSKTVAILKTNRSVLKSNFDNLYYQLNSAKEKYNRAISDFTQYKDQHASQIQKKLQGLDLPKKLKDNYVEQIKNWFAAEINSAEFFFDQSRTTIINYASYVNSTKENVQYNFQNFLTQLRKFDMDSTNTPIPDYFYNYFSINGLDNFSDINITGYDKDLDNLPPLPQLGTDWGPLGKIASWLISAQSVDLILIVGMFGFGLLGSAISSFVNSDKNIQSNRPIIENLSIVIIRGFSAAIVIFLATKGGIAIFNNGSNVPNPYVLFFTCLIGAVYSERIWDWAKTQIGSRYPAGTSPQGSTPLQGGTLPQGGNPPRADSLPQGGV